MNEGLHSNGITLGGNWDTEASLQKDLNIGFGGKQFYIPNGSLHPQLHAYIPNFTLTSPLHAYIPTPYHFIRSRNPLALFLVFLFAEVNLESHRPSELSL